MADVMPFTMPQVLDLVNAKYKGKGKWVDVDCPYAKGQKIRVNLSDGRWNCFHECSSCPRHPRPGSSGILDLYCFFSGVDSRKEAYMKLMDEFNLSGSVPRTQYKPPVNDIIVPSTPVDPSNDESLAPIDVRDDTYRKFLSLCTLSKRHRQDLMKRGLKEKDIQEIGYRSVPQAGLNQIAKALVGSGAVLDRVPGFYFDKKSGSYKICPHKSGVFIPYFDIKGRIQGLQIRYDVKITPDMDKKTVKSLKQKRYRWFSSAWLASDSSKDGTNDTGTQSKNYAYFGTISSVPEDEELTAVYVTEGALKAQTAQSLCKTVYGKSRIFVAVPGVSCYSTFEALCEQLKRRGVSIIVDAFDSDRNTNESVCNAIRRMHTIAVEQGLQFKTWNFGDSEKGVDDFLLAKAIREKKIIV